MVKGKPIQRVDADLLFARGVAAARAGQRKRARRLLAQLVSRCPAHHQGWLWLSYLSKDPVQARLFVRRALQIAPRDMRAIHRLRRLDSLLAVRPRRYYLPRALGYLLLIALILLLLGGFAARMWSSRSPDLDVVEDPRSPPTAIVVPTCTPAPAQLVADAIPRLKDAWRSRDWAAAAALLDSFVLLAPSYPGLDAARCDTYVNWARELAEQGKVEEAYLRYGYAARICRDNSAADERQMALRYLSGRWRYERGLWAEAIVPLREVYDADPEYADVRSLLVASYVAYGESLLHEGRVVAAKRACEAASAVEPGDDAVRALCERIKALPTPTPTPLPTPRGPRKLIEVDISEQRMYVWEGDRLLYKWVCSTGEPGRDTAIGRFQVLDKLPEAWSSTWNLRMPYWLGIYYVGSLENGIHALPILPNGQTLWAGYLGSRVSFGCIILGTDNARTLYHWADIGTPVWIHP